MGFLVGILNGVVVAFQNSQFKKLKAVHSHVINWTRFIVAIPIVALLVTIFSHWTVPPLHFWLVLIFLSLPVEMLNSHFYVKAFQVSPQSLVGPLFSLSLIFLMPLSYFFLGEVPSTLGIIGVVLVVLGTFFLGWDVKDPGFRASLKTIFKQKGAFFMILAGLGGAFAVTFSKFSFRYVSPLEFAFFITVALAIIYTPLALRRGISIIKKEPLELGLMNVAYGVGQSLHYIGLSLLPAAYYISVKRSSILFDVLFGKFKYHETHFVPRLIGSLIMISGLVLVAVASI